MAKFTYESFYCSELDAAIKHTPLVYLPAGSLEWHGEHIVLGCDMLRGHVICTQAAQLGGGIVLPPFWIASPGYSAYRGSIVFSPRVVEDVVTELYRELEKVGFRICITFLGHGGPSQDYVFNAAAERHSRAGKMHIATLNEHDFLPKELALGGHAQLDETLECMGTGPGNVDMSRFAPNETTLPRYEGLDPAPYQLGLTGDMADHVARHMSATQWMWGDWTAEDVTPERAQERIQTVAEHLAAKAQELLAQIS